MFNYLIISLVFFMRDIFSYLFLVILSEGFFEWNVFNSWSGLSDLVLSIGNFNSSNNWSSNLNWIVNLWHNLLDLWSNNLLWGNHWDLWGKALLGVLWGIALDWDDLRNSWLNNLGWCNNICNRGWNLVNDDSGHI